MRIVSSMGGHICNCSFESCTSDSQRASNGDQHNFILFYDDRCKESENVFAECNASQTYNRGSVRKYELKASQE